MLVACQRRRIAIRPNIRDPRGRAPTTWACIANEGSALEYGAVRVLLHLLTRTAAARTGGLKRRNRNRPPPERTRQGLNDYLNNTWALHPDIARFRLPLVQQAAPHLRLIRVLPMAINPAETCTEMSYETFIVYNAFNATSPLMPGEIIDPGPGSRDGHEQHYSSGSFSHRSDR